MIGRRCRLFGGVALPALASGFILANMTAVAPVHAAACTGAVDTANSTTCTGGSTGQALTYVNNSYVEGNFTLDLNNHDVTDGGISLAGTVADPDGLLGDGDGFIILRNDSDVINRAGEGINVVTDAAGEDVSISVLDTSLVRGSTDGIEIDSAGAVSIVTAAGASVFGTFVNGIQALAAGNISVDVAGRVTGGNTGINALSSTGVTSVVIRSDATVSGTTGNGIQALGASGVILSAGGNVSGGNTGINALSSNGAVSIGTGAGTTVAGTAGNGIQALAAGGVAVRADGNVRGGNTGINALSSNGAVTVTTGQDTIAEGFTGNGIDASSGSDGAVTVTTGVNSSVTAAGDGILATNNFGGAVTVATGDDSRVRGGDDGIDASSNSAELKIMTGANSLVAGNGDGIEATSISGAITITTGAGLNSSVQGTDDGIDAHSLSGGSVTVITGAGSQVTGSQGSGIKAATTGAGTIGIANNGLTLGQLAGIEAASGTGAILITNTSIIRNRTGASADLAIRTAGGATTIINGANILGRIVTGDSGDVLRNHGFWITEGSSNFGAGTDVVNNDGTIIGAANAGVASVTNFTGLDTLNNAGRIFLADQGAGDGSNISDRLQTDGDYAGQKGAGLFVDASLGGAGSLSDVLVVGGNTSGVTRVFVNNTSIGPGGHDPDGILVVDVAGTAEEDDFVLANGPIDTGFFVYDLVFNNIDQLNDQFLLVSQADSEAFETLATVAGSQEIWRETANAWEARQQTVRDRLATGAVVTAVADPPLTGGPAAENGLWFSALGSWIARDSEIASFDLSYDQSIYGFVAGADFGVDFGADSSLLFGVLAGYVDSSLNFDASPTSIKTDGATIGVYAGLLSDGFFANVLVKADLLNLNISAPSLGTDTSDDADVVSIGGRADLGYRFDAGDLFIEPMLSLDAISTAIDEFTLDGADIDAGTNESFRGGAGLRAGYAGEAARASLTGRIWNVFATDNEVTIAAFSVSDDGLEGLYGEVSGQFDVDLSSSTLLFVKGGVLFGDDITKPSVSGGFNFTW